MKNYIAHRGLVLALVALTFAECAFASVGEEVFLTSSFAVSNKKGGPPELDQSRWQRYRDDLAAAVKIENAQIRELNKSIVSQNPEEIIAMGPMDSNKLATLSMYAGAVKGLTRNLRAMARVRIEVIDEFGRAVSEAKQLCAQTTSWACRASDEEFSKSCTTTTNDTCRLNADMRDGSRMLDEAIEACERHAATADRVSNTAH